ncbi:unnamed protein product [Owenia fusiformis]|uniref:Uncharacterized protein n=1 Tax=Owenia fusiformis TaxID=6347 RepID=A0A8S4N1J7_OWEFU|nr:unnamed protein product [Owenia fusiformis]
MSLDYQRATYIPVRPDSKLNKTTYDLMNRWRRDISGESSANNNIDSEDRKQALGQIVSKLRSQRRPIPPVLVDRQETNKSSTSRNHHLEAMELFDEMGRPKPNVVMTQTGPIDLLSHYKDSKWPPYASMVDRRPSIDTDQPHLQYHKSGGYDDFHKAYMSLEKAGFKKGMPLPPKLRHGRGGSTWRNVKEVLQAEGKRIVFVDGQISIDDTWNKEKLQDIPKAPFQMREPSKPTYSHNKQTFPQINQKFTTYTSNKQHQKYPPEHQFMYIGKKAKVGHKSPVSSYKLAAFKGTENANWWLMR